RAQVVAPEFLDQRLVAVHHAIAAPHLRFRGISPASACARFRKDGSWSKSSRRMVASYLFELGQSGQGGRIRTYDLLVPSQERCRAALRPESGPSSRTRTCDLPARNRVLSSTELWMDDGAATEIRTPVQGVR